MAHKNFGIKPKCCGEDMFIDHDDDDSWFCCNVSGPIHTVDIPYGYFDNTPEEFETKETLGDILSEALLNVPKQKDLTDGS